MRTEQTLDHVFLAYRTMSGVKTNKALLGLTHRPGHTDVNESAKGRGGQGGSEGRTIKRKGKKMNTTNKKHGGPKRDQEKGRNEVQKCSECNEELTRTGL